MTESIDNLGAVAANAAMRASLEYLKAHNLKAEAGPLAECLRSHVKFRFPLALKDALEALECGMAKVAQSTFLASMALAGIEAAKEAGLPVGMVRQ